MSMKYADIKRRGLMLPKGEASGTTNATNPHTLTKLIAAHQELLMAKGVPVPTIPSKPIMAKVYVDSKFINMGALMGICPHELEAILAGEFTEEQTLILTYLKKFVSAAKLSGAVDLAPVHENLRETEENNRLNLEAWEINARRTEDRIKELNRKIRLREAEFAQAWGAILIDLQTKLQRNPEVSGLGSWDRYMVMAIQQTDVHYCSIFDGKVVLDFAKCKTMPVDDIMNLRSRANAIKDHEKDLEYDTWLHNAPLDELVNRMWTMGRFGEEITAEEAREHQQLEWAIIARSGKIPVRNFRGELDWHATLNGDPDQYEDERENEKRELIKAHLRDRATKVKSGSGKA